MKFISYFLLISFALNSFGCDNNSDDESSPKTEIPEEIPQPEAPKPTANSTVNISQSGNLIDVFFYDIKQGNKSITSENMAVELFVKDGINGLRIPILGTQKVPAHPAEGTVVENMYDDVLKSIAFAKKVSDQEVILFASKKLDGKNSFPDWTKNDAGIIPEKYAILLADFLEFLDSKDIEIKFLGIDNEFVYNEGNITPQKYIETLNILKNLLTDRGINIPKFVGYEDYGPDKRNWVRDLNNLGGAKLMDVYGTHYYPQFRPKNKLEADLARINGKPFWSTEPHWDSKSDADNFKEAEEAILALWDQIDLGMSGFMWWSYGLNDQFRSELMRATSRPLLGSVPVDITDVDGKNIDGLGKFGTRAFLRDNLLTIIVVNRSASSYENYIFEVEDYSIVNNITVKQWSESGLTSGELIPVNTYSEFNGIFSTSIPSNTFTVISFKITQD